MPLYELVCIASHSPALGPMKALTQTTSALITANGGLVRTLDYWGLRNLPQPMKRGDKKERMGHYWTMQFDANPPTVNALNERLRLDPRVLRWTTLKKGVKLHEIAELPSDPTVKFDRPPPASTEGDDRQQAHRPAYLDRLR